MFKNNQLVANITTNSENLRLERYTRQTTIYQKVEAMWLPIKSYQI